MYILIVGLVRFTIIASALFLAINYGINGLVVGAWLLTLMTPAPRR